MKSPPLFVSSPCCWVVSQASVAAAVAVGVGAGVAAATPPLLLPRSGLVEASGGSARSAGTPCRHPASGPAGRAALGLAPASYLWGLLGGPRREGATLHRRYDAHGSSAKENDEGTISTVEFLGTSQSALGDCYCVSRYTLWWSIVSTQIALEFLSDVAGGHQGSELVFFCFAITKDWKFPFNIPGNFLLASSSSVSRGSTLEPW